MWSLNSITQAASKLQEQATSAVRAAGLDESLVRTHVDHLLSPSHI